MQFRSIFLAQGLLYVLVLSALGFPQKVRAQPPGAATAQAARMAGASGEAVQADEAKLRLEAQVHAQLKLMELQRRQLEQQANEQVQQLEEQAAEQIEQLKGEANRQIQQLKSQLSRQIEQVKRQLKRQEELLEAQMKVVEAQGATRPEATRDFRRMERVPPESRERKPQRAALPAVEDKLEKILGRLEYIEKRLDSLERRK
jgi:hypothetical protein